jgi:hypothetical protein
MIVCVDSCVEEEARAGTAISTMCVVYDIVAQGTSAPG